MAIGPHRTVTERVQDQLRDLILSGTLPPGSRIDQAELAQRFQVSLVPIREALARLQSSGLVRIIPHRGVFIAHLSVEELIDIYHVREVLEEQAARLAAPRLSDDEIAQIEALAQREQELADKDAFDAFLDINRELHFIIYRASARPHLLKIIAQLWDQSIRYRRLQLAAIPTRAKDSMVETRAIVDACRRRDADALGMMVRYKVHQTTVGLLTTIDLTASADEGENAVPVLPA